MKGCVKNITSGWAHAFKRAVSPGEEIPLDELYEAYGEKHGLAKGEEFIRWIREVKLTNTSKWKVIMDEDKPPVVEVDEKAKDLVTPIVPTKMNVMDIVELSVREAKEILPKITDIKLLKYASKEANGRSGKDSLCRMLKKRVTELGTFARF